LKLADCSKLKDIVFEVDERIRYFGLLDNKAGMVMSELRRKEEAHPREYQLIRDLTFFKGAMSTWGLYFGRVNYSLVSHDSFKIIMIPIEAGLLIITSEPTLPPELVEKLSSKVREQIAAGKV
jgi:hypothetical protein